MFSIAAASVLLLAGTVLAEPLATIAPCVYGNVWNVSVPPITVTSQYQTVSTCAPTTVCGKRGLCKTSYPFETFKYVSTVIPCAFNSSGGSSTTVTATNQPVTVSKFRTTLISYSTPKGPRHPKPTPVYTTIGQDYVLPYNEIGPLAIPGWGGSGLCTNSGEDSKGARHQPLPVTECTAGPAGTKCVQYTKTLVSTPAPAATSATAAACSTSFNAPSAGTYTFTFPHTAPARTITADGHTFTLESYPFNVFASRFFAHGGPWNFATTFTTTITQTVPASTAPPTATHSAPVPTFWDHPHSGNHPPFGDHQASSSSSISFLDSSTSGRWSYPSSSSADPGSWLDWSSSSSPSMKLSSASSSISTSESRGPHSTSATTTPLWYSTTSSSSTSSTPFSSSTSSSSSSTWTSTTSTTPTPSTIHIPATAIPIYVTAEIANAHYRKRAIDYVSFPAGGDAVLSSDASVATTFYLYLGYLIDALTGAYVGTVLTTGSGPLEEFTDAADASSSWTVSDGVLSVAGATFCYTTDLSLFDVYVGSTTPAGCIPVVLGVAPISSTTSTSSSTTTPSAPQRSSDLEEYEMENQEKEVEAPEAVNKRAVKKRHGLLRTH